jgi:alpha-2-macroglobulin
VKFKAISRFVDTDRLLGAGKGKAVLRVYDSRRRKLIERDISFNESGTFDDFFTLPAAGMGWHSLEIDFNPVDSEDHPDWRLISSHGFQVEDYRVNTFEIDFDAEREYTQAEGIEIPLSATYYMGKPLSRAELQWNLYAHSEFPRPRGFDEFRFGDVTRPYQTHSDDGTATLTSAGAATVEVALPEESANPGPRRVSLTAQVTDANQQTISNSTRFTVHSSDFYLGMREPEGVHRAGDTATFSLAAVTSGGQAHTAPVPTTVLVEKEIWNTVKVMGADGRFTHRNDRRLETVSEENFTLETEVDAATGLTRAVPREFTFAEAGDYLITLTARDDQGRPVLTRVRFTVIGATEPSWSWYDVIRIDLTPDKDSYRIGDTARLLARSPVFGHALLTTERGGVRSTRALEITDYETILEIPVEEGDAPNVFASLLIVRGSEDSPHVHTSADYRLGYCQLSVEDPASRLEVVIDSGEAPSYQPGEEVTVSALVRDAKGGPVSGAEVTLFAVDEGVLSLTAHPTPDPHSVFHEEFPLAVSTGQSLSDLLPENPLEQDFGNKGYVIGGGGAPGLDPDRVRKDFKALAFWEPTLHTGEDGVVTATFEAPDNLTTFRIMAVVAEGNRFGHAEAPVLINKPLIIEPALPGFTNVTDQIDVTAVLHNTTDRRQEVEVNVRLDEHAIFLHEIGDAIPTSLAGTAEETQRTAKAFLEPGSTETLSFPIALTSVGEAKWTWEVRSLTEERLRDATESTIAVGYPLPLLRETHSFTLKEGDSFEEALHAVAPRLLKGEGSITVTLSNSRLVEAADGLDYLLQYPYGCLEQTTSSLIPWLMTHQLRPVLPQLEQSDEQIAATISGGIQKILSMQTNDGGLGYWPGAHQSELWASAYGGLALLLASQQGIEVPEEQALALWDYLAKNLRETSELGNPYELSQRCLAVYTLALAGINESSYHEVLYDKRSQLSGEARSLLALAMVESGGQIPERIETLLSPDEKVPVAEVSWYRQPYVASTRLLAQLRQDPKSERIDGLLNDLLKLREARRGWGNTYSNAWSLIALAAYGDSVKDSLAANEVAVRFGDREETLSFPAEPGNGSLSFAFDGEVDRDALRLAPSQSAPIYATLTVETRPELMPVEPENRGFAISRRYEKVEIDGSISALDDPRVGDLVLVTLDINLPNERESYLAIDDALPAIFEAVNPDFKSQATQRVNAESRVRTLRPNHREIRKDRVLFFADRVLGAGDYSLQYLARVVAPGEVTAPPAKIEAMYEPQRFGLSGTARISAGPLLQQPARVVAR